MNNKIVQTAGREQLGDFAPGFAHLNDDILFGEVWNEEAIDIKTKCIITNDDTNINTEKDRYQNEIFFPIGVPNDAYAKYFVGKSYLAPISTEQMSVFNVTFEPGCRNNWHIHKANTGGGQILICVGGRGFYQEWEKEPVVMLPGTVINIPVNVKHWHGAAPDSWFSHLAIEIPGENTGTEWMEPVSDTDYLKL